MRDRWAGVTWPLGIQGLVIAAELADACAANGYHARTTMTWRRQNSPRGQTLVLVVITLALLGGGLWYLYRSRQENERAAWDFAGEAATRIALRYDERFLDSALSPAAQITYPPSWRARFFTRIRDLSPPDQTLDLAGRTMFTSQFFDLRGIFRVRINSAENPAYLDLEVSHPRALWQIDNINLTWMRHTEETPPTP